MRESTLTEGLETYHKKTTQAAVSFGFIKVCYRGLAKNGHYLFVSCALVNLVMAGKTLFKKAMI